MKLFLLVYLKTKFVQVYKRNYVQNKIDHFLFKDTIMNICMCNYVLFVSLITVSVETS